MYGLSFSLFFAGINYTYGNHDCLHEMIAHPLSVLGGSDGGAHCTYICDASVPTFMLTHWGRDRKRGPRFPLEWLVKKQTLDTARVFSLNDYKSQVQTGDEVRVNTLQVPPSMEDVIYKVKETDINEDFISLVKEYKPHIVGLTATEPTYLLGKSLIELISKRKDILKIVFLKFEKTKVIQTFFLQLGFVKREE
mgnify:CR=1 FL=1